MWVLHGQEGPVKEGQWWLKPEKDYVLGRKAPDILIPNDRSVSREHAMFKVKTCKVLDTTPTAVDVVSLGTDPAKAAITEINGRQLSLTDTHKLRDGDILQFGKLSKFRASKHSVVVCLARADKSQVKDLKHRFVALDWKCTDKWEKGRSTHMWIDSQKQIRSNYADIQCLVAGGVFIGEDFLAQVETKKDEMEANFRTMPDAAEYFPPVRDVPDGFTKDAWRPNPQRGDLFQGLTFVFLEDKLVGIYDRWSPVVVIGGGKADNLAGDACLETSEALASRIILYPKGLLVTDFRENDATDEEARVQGLAVEASWRLKQRVIDLKEIFYAVLSASLDKYCNVKAKAPFGKDDPTEEAGREENNIPKQPPEAELSTTVPKPAEISDPATLEDLKVKTEMTDAERRRKRKRAENPLAGLMDMLIQNASAPDPIAEAEEDQTLGSPPRKQAKKEADKDWSAAVNAKIAKEVASSAQASRPSKRKEIFVTAAIEDPNPPKKRKKAAGIVSKEDLVAALRRHPLPANEGSDDEDVNEATDHLRGLLIVKQVDLGRKDGAVESYYPANGENPKWAGMPNFKRFKKKQPAVSQSERTYIKMVPYNKDYGIGRAIRGDVEVRNGSIDHNIAEIVLSETTIQDDSVDDDDQPIRRGGRLTKSQSTQNSKEAQKKAKTIKDFYGKRGTAASSSTNRRQTQDSDDEDQEVQFSWDV